MSPPQVKPIHAGCRFLVPYLLLYLVFWFFKLPANPLRILYQLLHVVLLGYWATQAFRARRLFTPWDICFWFSIGMMVTLPGAFMEFPSDPWEHANRIFQWTGYNDIHVYPSKQRHIYFWANSLLGGIPIAHRPLALMFYSGFWQTLLAVELFLFFSACGIRKPLAQLATFTFFCGFGSNIFGIRYYALSSFMPAYIAYIWCLRNLIDSHRNSTSFSWTGLLASALIILVNHPQELLFLGMMSISYGLFELYHTRSRHRRWLALVTGLILALSLWAIIFPSTWASSDVLTELSRGYTFKLLSPESAHFRTIGVLGFFSFAMSLTLWRSYPLLCWLAWTPIVLCLWPPFVLIFSRLTDVYSTYRILYAFPFVTLLPLALDSLCSRKDWLKNEALRLGLIGILLTLLFLPQFRWYGGRLWFQLSNPNRELWLEDLAPLASWARRFESNCVLLTDNITGSFIQAHLRFPDFMVKPGQSRMSTSSFLHPAEISELDFLLKADLRKNKNGSGNAIRGIFAMILPIAERTAMKYPESILAQRSGHWTADHVRAGLTLPPLVRERLVKFAQQWNWQSVPLHPDYDVYLWTNE